MRSLEDSLEDIYKRAKYKKIADSIRTKKIIKKTSLCASFCVVFIIAVVIMGQFDGAAKLFGKNGDKLWISDIPGAEYVNDLQGYGGSSGIDAIVKDLTRGELVENLKSKSFLVVGEVTNVKSFFIDYEPVGDACHSWLVTTFDLKIIKEINGTLESDTIKCVKKIEVVRTNYRTYSLRSSVSKDWSKVLSDGLTAAFTLSEVGTREWMVSGEHYQVSDYADYFLGSVYPCDDEGILVSSGNTIKWEEVKKQVES